MQTHMHLVVVSYYSMFIFFMFSYDISSHFFMYHTGVPVEVISDSFKAILLLLLHFDGGYCVVHISYFIWNSSGHPLNGP